MVNKLLKILKFFTSSVSTVIYSRQMRPLALCVFQHNGRILVQDVSNRTEGVAYCRPLGGGIDFREHSADAIVREIQEELGAEVVDVTFLGVIESIFTYNGVGRHEFVFVYDAKFVDETLYEQETIEAKESFGTFTATWRSIDDLKTGNMRLVPEQLFELLEKTN